MYGQTACIKLHVPHPPVLGVRAVGFGGDGFGGGVGGGADGKFRWDARDDFVGPVAPVVDFGTGGGGVCPGGEGHGLGTGLGRYPRWSGVCGLRFGRGGGAGLAVVSAPATATATSAGVGLSRQAVGGAAWG